MKSTRAQLVTGIVASVVAATFTGAARAERLRPSGLPQAVAPRSVTKTIPAVDLGEVRSGTTECGSTGLDGTVAFEGPPPSTLPESVELGALRGGVLWPVEALPATGVCLRVDLWAPSMAEREVSLLAREEGRRGRPIVVPVRFSVRRAPRVGHVLTLVWFPLTLLLILLFGKLRQPRFDGGEVLAWVVDRPGGYRDSAARKLEVMPLRQLLGGKGAASWSRGSLPLHRALATEEELLPVIVEPLPGGGVHVGSTVSLVVRREGDEAPVVAGTEATVPYGSVVRAGPLVFAVLLGDQRARLDSGGIRLDLPAASDVSPGAAGAAEHLEAPRRLLFRPGAAVVGWGLLLLSSVGAGLAAALLGPATGAAAVLGESALAMAAVAGVGVLVARVAFHRGGDGQDP